MPQIHVVSVTNQNTQVVWVTNQNATTFTNFILVNASKANQPPVGFLNNPNHTFIITGTEMPTGMPYTSPAWNPDPSRSEPPLIYAFH